MVTFQRIVLGFLGLATGVGVYTAASRFSVIGSMFYLSIGAISTPIIADLHSQAKTTQMKAYYQTTTRWMMMFNLPVFLTSVLFAKPMLSIFGDDFTTGATSMMILAFGTLAYTCTGTWCQYPGYDRPSQGQYDQLGDYGFCYHRPERAFWFPRGEWLEPQLPHLLPLSCLMWCA